MVLKKLKTSFSVIGPDQPNKFFPYMSNLPRPGQWIYVESDRYSVSRILVQVASVDITHIEENLYRVTMEVNRASLKEDILFAKLARRQFDQVDRDSEIVEPIYFTEIVAREEEFTITIMYDVPGYSNANYSNGEFSEP